MADQRADQYVVGVDFGTLSGRAIVARVADGVEVGAAVHEYAHGVIDRVLPATGAELPPDWALQDPRDYVDVLRRVVPAALAASGVDPADVIGIGTDFTACTIMPTLADGTPLCLLPDLEGEPHAYPKLWKHHAAQRHADRIIWRLCGAETRNACTAGYKAIRQDGRYPSREFLAALDERFTDLFAAKMDHPVSPLGGRAGGLTEEAARWTGLRPGTTVAVGNVDAHVTAPAAQAVEPGRMLLVMGTSTCHVMNGTALGEIPGMCGVVDGGIVAGLWGYEAGQSGVGDIFAWYVDHGVPPAYHEEAKRTGESLHDLLTRHAAAQEVGEHGLVALDWLNGNRSVLVDHELSGVVLGLTLATRPPEIYRALLESTAFGTRKIIESFEQAGVPVDELIVAGGLTQNRFLMQIYADVTRRPFGIAGSAQGPALGSAIHAAVAAGAYPDVPAAAAAMGRVERDAFLPDPARAAAYDELYE